jgi:hypothetical protein
VKRNEDTVSVPRGATLAFRRPSVSGREAAGLAAVAAMLVPLLMFAGGVLSLPSLLERGFESLIPRLADGKSHLQPVAAPSRSGALVGAALSARVVIPVAGDRSSRGGASVASGESQRVTSSRGSRAASVNVPEVPQAPVPAVTGASPPAGAGPSGGGGSGPGDHGPGGPGPGGGGPAEPRPPAVSVGVNGTTVSVNLDTGVSPATGTATVSASTSRASAAGTVAGVSISAGAALPSGTGAGPTAAVTVDTSQVAVPDVTATVESVLAPQGG